MTNKIKIMAIDFNKMVYHKTGKLSIRTDQLNDYVHDIKYSRIVKGNHKTLGNFITLIK